MAELDFNIIATGSQGNAVRIKNIMIDCGIPFKHMKTELYKVDTLLITHRHSDHVKDPTLSAIRKNFPHIKIIGNYDVGYIADVDIICNAKKPIKLRKGVEVMPFECVHDVVCNGFVITFPECKVLYATDTNSLEFAPVDKYDFMFLEANHDENKIKQVQGKRNKYGYDVFAKGMNHLSIQKCWAFYYMNRRDSESKLIELHQSSRFY